MNSKQKEALALDYRLDVQDFGPIARASVEMRPLTVFIGPSNTGKSYLAMLLYVLHRCLGTGGHWPDNPLRQRAYFGNMAWRVAKQDALVREAFMGWVASVFTNESPPPLPDELLKHVHSNLERPHILATALDHELRRCFGVDDLRALARRGGGRKPTVAVSGPPETQPQSTDVQVARYEFKLAATVDLAGNIPLDLLSRSLMEQVETEKSFIEELDDLQDEVRASIYLKRNLERVTHRFLGAARQQAHYLPADRTGVMHSHQVVVGALVQNAPMAGIRPAADMPALSGVLADFLYQLINMPGHPRRRSDLAKQFEESLLAGAVRMETSGANYPSFLYRPRGWEEDLPLMRTSSMVSELAPVVLYLRHVVQRGDVLIVEEPEAHLHPAMQAAFARELARLVRAGVRIVLTTHSEWLLEQIGNLVRLSALPKKRRAGIEGADVALEPGQVGAWLFKPSQRPRGSIVQEVKPDSQTGLFPTDFDDVSLALYNDGAEIFNRLQEEQGQ